VLPIQAGFVLLGTMGSFAASFRFAERDYPTRAARAAMPWHLVAVLSALAPDAGTAYGYAAWGCR
jgi:hypothetical protein